jgi:cytochrome c oxidase subunit 4
MTDPHHPATGHHGPDFRLYMVVAAALAVFTAASFGVNEMVRHDMLTPVAGFLAILGVAVCKAVLVGLYFMHLRWEWGKLYFMIIPAFILGAMMMFVLMPDGVLAWRYERSESPVPKATR